MLPPKTCLLLVGLCLLFRYSVCDGPRIRTCTGDADCTYLGDAFCDSTSPKSCKCDSGFYPYIGDTPVPDAGSTSPDVNCLVDSFVTTTPRMTITTKSPRRGIGNFVPFLAIPGMFEFLVDNNHVVFGNQVFQQYVGIPMVASVKEHEFVVNG
uniref:Uncharacterized protein n=1 Tax=Magallana gigas TaxID=29159 RepID=K1QZC5_MAGGI